MKRFVLLSVMLLSCLIATDVIAESRWVEAKGYDCRITCKDEGLKAFSTGAVESNNKHAGRPYYLCAAYHEGWRPGLNLGPTSNTSDWSNLCFIATGIDSARTLNKFSCYCTD